jgi:predicted alpha-1,2-mannosidase
MKIRQTLTGLVVGTIVAASCSTGNKGADGDFASFVNPIIGTGGHGHTFPGAVVPHGMVQPSPDTRIDGWDACAGYYYADSTINGFSQNHLSGTGCCDLGDVLIMPTVGTQQWNTAGVVGQTLPYASAFDHANEIAEPGYYSVTLDRYNVKAEITAAERGAYYRFTFPESDQSGFIIDMDYSLNRQRDGHMEIKAISDTEITGSKTTYGWAPEQTINFYAKFSKPFTFTKVSEKVDTVVDGKPWSGEICKGLLQFATKADEEVTVQVGISAVDIDGARNNVTTSLADKSFDAVKDEARGKWNDFLSKIDVTTPNDSARTIFYTALYHTGISPYIFSDADGRYLGMDGKIHHTTGDTPIYTIFSLWDTFRAFHPLKTITDPDLNGDFVRSILSKGEQGGILPKWELNGNYTGCMIGYHAVPVIVDAYMKGYRGFDAEKALEQCVRTATYDEEVLAGIHGDRRIAEIELMPKSKYYKNELGYIPSDKENESVAKGLEYAYNDWCIARFAEALGNDSIMKVFDERAGYYRNYYDAESGFMRGKLSDGTWREPFNPRGSNHRDDDYCEGTAWQWLWFVPHDVEGLIDLMGGRDKFEAKLDSLFAADSKIEGEFVSSDISGLIGQYAHGNEPSHHILHLYNYIDKPEKTQELIDRVFKEQYFNGPDGLSGNEDCGQMSAWYVLNALGFYQVAPGTPVYSIGRPLFERAEVELPGGKKFTVVARGNSGDNKYISSMKLNGKELRVPFFSHEELMRGGTLELQMTNKP